jgi:hypothetical protein
MDGGQAMMTVQAEGQTEGARTEPEGLKAAFGPGFAAFPPPEEHVPVESGRRALLLPALAILAITGWTAVFLVAFWTVIAGGSAPEIVGLFGTWSVPVLLVLVVWVLVRGNSSAEEHGIQRAAGLLGSETARFEARLQTLNGELGLARQFLEAQSRELDSLGRVAVERLGQSGARLSEMVQTNAERIEAIAEVSRVALDNMEALRNQLPVLASSTKDVTNFIGSAGRNAQEHVESLQTALKQLSDTGLANEQQVRTMRAAVESATGEFARQCEQLGSIADVRFTALADRSEAFRGQLDGHETAALAAVRNRAGAFSEELSQLTARLEAEEQLRILGVQQHAQSLRSESDRLIAALRTGEDEALGRWREAVARIESDVGAAFVIVENAGRDAHDASHQRLVALSDEVERIDAALHEREEMFSTQIAGRRAAVGADEDQAWIVFEQRLAQLDAAIGARRAEQEHHAAALAAHDEAIIARLSQCEERMAEIAAHGGQVGARLTGELHALTEGLAQSRATLAATNGDVVALSDTTAQLLEGLRAASAHSRDELPAAIDQGAARFADLADQNTRLLATLADAQQQGESLSGLMQKSGGQLLADFGEIAALQSSANDKAGAHGEQLAALLATLGTLDEANEYVLAKARGEFAETLSQLARQLGDASADALGRALRVGTAQTAGKLEQAAAHAVGVSSEAALQLRDEVDRIAELTSGIEARLAKARTRAETRIDQDFARRAAMINDRLNSEAIDIARALDRDIPEASWSDYVRGKRGLFARRAVRLLDAKEASAVAAIYEADSEFREHVSRYIADFETMLRELLGAETGHTFAVTLLSSDLGKLYVALAQGIERIRR